MSTGTNIQSTGSLCGSFQIGYAALQAAIERAGVRPTITIDGVPHFDAGAVELIRAAIIVPIVSRTGRGAIPHVFCATK